MQRLLRSRAALLLMAVVLAALWLRVVQPAMWPSSAGTHETVDLDAARAAFAAAERGPIDAVLGRLAHLDPPPVDWLLEGLRHPDRGVREWSAHALGDLAPKEGRVVDALLVAFEDEDDWVRWKAARALGALRARRALPALRAAAAAEQEAEVVRAAAQAAVEVIERGA